MHGSAVIAPDQRSDQHRGLCRPAVRSGRGRANCPPRLLCRGAESSYATPSSVTRSRVPWRAGSACPRCDSREVQLRWVPRRIVWCRNPWSEGHSPLAVFAARSCSPSLRPAGSGTASRRAGRRPLRFGEPHATHRDLAPCRVRLRRVPHRASRCSGVAVLPEPCSSLSQWSVQIRTVGQRVAWGGQRRSPRILQCRLDQGAVHVPHRAGRTPRRVSDFPVQCKPTLTFVRKGPLEGGCSICRCLG